LFPFLPGVSVLVSWLVGVWVVKVFLGVENAPARGRARTVVSVVVLVVVSFLAIGCFGGTVIEERLLDRVLEIALRTVQRNLRRRVARAAGKLDSTKERVLGNVPGRLTVHIRANVLHDGRASSGLRDWGAGNGTSVSFLAVDPTKLKLSMLANLSSPVLARPWTASEAS
jgi:hypothetical protein